MKRITKQELIDVLENLTNRFPLEHGTVIGNVAGATQCRCLQFEDNDECRHTIAMRAVKKARLK